MGLEMDLKVRAYSLTRGSKELRTIRDHVSTSFMYQNPNASARPTAQPVVNSQSISPNQALPTAYPYIHAGTSVSASPILTYSQGQTAYDAPEFDLLKIEGSLMLPHIISNLQAFQNATVQSMEGLSASIDAVKEMVKKGKDDIDAKLMNVLRVICDTNALQMEAATKVATRADSLQQLVEAGDQQWKSIGERLFAIECSVESLLEYVADPESTLLPPMCSEIASSPTKPSIRDIGVSMSGSSGNGQSTPTQNITATPPPLNERRPSPTTSSPAPDLEVELGHISSSPEPSAGKRVAEALSSPLIPDTRMPPYHDLSPAPELVSEDAVEDLVNIERDDNFEGVDEEIPHDRPQRPFLFSVTDVSNPEQTKRHFIVSDTTPNAMSRSGSNLDSDFSRNMKRLPSTKKPFRSGSVSSLTPLPDSPFPQKVLAYASDTTQAPLDPPNFNIPNQFATQARPNLSRLPSSKKIAPAAPASGQSHVNLKSNKVAPLSPLPKKGVHSTSAIAEPARKIKDMEKHSVTWNGKQSQASQKSGPSRAQKKKRKQKASHYDTDMDGEESGVVGRQRKRKRKLVKSWPCNWPVRGKESERFQRTFIQCDRCDAWFHYGCVGIAIGDLRIKYDSAELICPPCGASIPNDCEHRPMPQNYNGTCRRPDCFLPHEVTDEYTIERIVGRRPRVEEGRTGYVWLIKWEGYPIGQAEWLPEENLMGHFIQLQDHFNDDAMKEGLNFEDEEQPVLLKEALEGGWVL